MKWARENLFFSYPLKMSCKKLSFFTAPVVIVLFSAESNHTENECEESNRFAKSDNGDVL